MSDSQIWQTNLAEAARIMAVVSAENAGYDDVATRDAWVIRFGEHHFEYAQRFALWLLVKSDGRQLWMDRFNTHHQDKDVFDTELAARNELEKRLYRRSENLRKHREAMSRLLVRCADTFNQEQEATK